MQLLFWLYEKSARGRPDLSVTADVDPPIPSPERSLCLKTFILHFICPGLGRFMAAHLSGGRWSVELMKRLFLFRAKWPRLGPAGFAMRFLFLPRAVRGMS
jgi:hypothetical protein